ncbi:SH3 domain-containing protein [Candidatus Uhrbacteria bacterium]|nr:MAG: SH3 domain-containing protein [Candidatus Uhrbacteria bacterium]
MKKLLSFLSGFSLLFAMVPAASAGGCYVDPVHQYSGKGTIKSGVFLRDHACMDGSVILTTLAAGASVDVIGFTDGWYRIAWNGGRGWIGMQFLDNGAQRTGTAWSSYHEYMSQYPSVKPGTSTPTSAPTTSDSTILGKTKGHILLQVQQHGEAWYVDPVTLKRYYMKDGPTAYQMMRSFGLGVSEKDYTMMAKGDDALKSKLRGRIVLRAQAKGEAYYIHPKDLKMHYLQNGEEAYKVMRLYSLGITDADLAKLASATVPIK